MPTRTTFILLMCCLIPILVALEDTDDLLQINKLRYRLMKQQRYQRMARPVKRHTTVTNVSLTLFFRRIVDIDSIQNSMKTFATVNLEWKDEHLTWNPSDFGGLDEINFDFWEIWTPDIRSWDIMDGNQRRQMGKDPIRVNSTGIVSWWTRAVFTSSCLVDLKDFPFDTQTCHLFFLSWNYDIRSVNITQSRSFKKSVYGPFQKNPEWQVINVEEKLDTYNESAENLWPSVSVSFTVKRRNNIYAYRTLFPYLAGILFALLSFIEPPGTNRRLLLAGISIIILMVIMIQLAVQLGPHSVSIPYAIKCVGITIIVLSTSIMSSLLIHGLISKLTRSNVLLPRVLLVIVDNDFLQKILFIRDEVIPLHKDHQNQSSSRQEYPPPSLSTSPSSSTHQVISKEWLTTGRFVDRICLITFILVVFFYHM